MKPFGGIPVIVKILQKIRLAIVVKIMEAGDLIVSDGIDFSVDDLQPEGLMQPGGKTFPFEVLQLIIVDARNDPHIAIPGADGAVFPSSKKSKAPIRIRGSYWLLKGIPMRSTT